LFINISSQLLEFLEFVFKYFIIPNRNINEALVLFINGILFIIFGLLYLSAMHRKCIPLMIPTADMWWKTNLMVTNNYWNPFFTCRWKSHLCTIQRHQALDTRWPSLLLQVVFCNTVKPWGCISWPVWPLRGINKIACCAKLILTADLAYPVSCASLGHLRMAQHCHLSLNICFSPPTALHCPAPIDSVRDITAVKKLPQKPEAFK